MELLKYDIFNDETIDFSKDNVYTDKLKIHVNLL